MSDRKIPEYIAIDGPIGVGKTTLAKRLAEDLNGQTILEQSQENPFLEKFYQEPDKMALPTQLCFLFQRTKQLQNIPQSDLFHSCRIADFVLGKDMLFAEATLDPDELELYQQVYSNMTIDAPKPDLVVYLQAPTDVLIKRIRQRSHNFEQLIQSDYLKKIADAYARYFHYFSECPLLIVNASGLDLVNNETDYEQLKQRILNVQPGRHYFNPIPFAS